MGSRKQADLPHSICHKKCTLSTLLVVYPILIDFQLIHFSHSAFGLSILPYILPCADPEEG